MITYHNGDLLKSGCEMICHQVNEFGVMCAGIAKQIRDTYPKCYTDYKQCCDTFTNAYGSVCFSKNDDLVIANCFSQICGRTDYDKLDNVVINIIKYCEKHNIRKVGIPYKYGSGLAVGSWQDVFKVFNKHFENSEIELQIWKYEGV